ncbi:MAG: formate dehydrogenase [candidate division Zixibacteria bacterium SM23_73_2]|nr:MAG: formate dehydrogenase [candidate division Zixibacteria bacterium SM23_73_2]
MTNHWIDIKNADCIMIIGSNAAENHPISFKWVTEAMDNGAKLISVDPRFTRTSARADLYVPIRSGTDIAFIGAVINYILENNLYNKEYLVDHTTVSFLVNPDFGFKDGYFTGYDKNKRLYDKSSWQYQLDENGIPKMDKTLMDPNCVFQLLKKHYSRYTLEKVSGITGAPPEMIVEAAKTYGATGAKDKSGTIMYAMGTTQHTVGTQNVRSYAMLQLLLGNVGVAGGGINALRGESNVQGSTDMALLFHILPGYLKTPRAENQTLEQYLEVWTPRSNDPKSANWWQHTPKYMVSLLKAFWRDKAQKENEFCYQYLPKVGANYSHISMFEAMYDGVIKGLICMGQNPAVGGPNVYKERKALQKLDWLVAVDLWETETAAFWTDPEVDPKKIKTEVFMLPAAASMEKEGSITNSGRWMQWRYMAVHPPGDTKSDLWILDRIQKELKKLYAQGGTFPDPIVHLDWDYGKAEEPDVHLVAKEVNGYDLTTGKLVASFANLKDDGTTSSGNWLYCNSYTENGNMAARRDPTDAPNKIGLYPNWSWCWPVNRRIIYNRASCDLEGNPYAPHKWVIKWTGPDTKWKGGDVPDGGWPPGDKYSFIMKPEGHARLFGFGLADGPFPEHYEPLESPVKNTMSSAQTNPTIVIWTKELDQIGTAKDFPIIATTYRVTEHWQAGQMTRNNPWLVELMPDMFVEMSKSLAQAKNIKNGDKVKIMTARDSIVAYAVVTDRFKPFKLNGKAYEQIGLPWHYGFKGLARGHSANRLTPNVGDANTMIPEYKAFLCDVKKEVG